MQNHSKIQSEEEIREFFKQWNIYQKVIEKNYMLHREMFHALVDTLHAAEGKAVSILDVGCGDAAITAKAINDRQVKEYCGIDLSAAALSYAEINLQSVDCKKQFIENDFASAMQQIRRPFDFIVAGFSLHHLQTDAKREFFKTAKNLLADGGCLVIYDLIRNDNEDREGYIDRLCAIYQEQWTAMTEQEMQEIVDHISNNDYPEKLEFYPKMAEENAFTNYQLKLRDADELYGFCCFR